METAIDSNFYFSLWHEFLTETLLSEFQRHAFAFSNQAEVQLTPELQKHRFDANLYPFICDRVGEFMESVYESHSSADMKNCASIGNAMMRFEMCTTIDAISISRALRPLKNAFLETTSSPFDSTTPIMGMVLGAFRKSYYYKLADSLREEAFGAISDDLKVHDPHTLTSYFRLIRKVGEDKVPFFIAEWDKPLYAHISKKLNESISSWGCGTLPEFLTHTETVIKDCRAIFLFFEVGIQSAVMEKIAKARDLLLFKNYKQFREIVLDAFNAESLKNLFDLFHEDDEFIEDMAHHATLLFCGVVRRRYENACHEFKNKEMLKELLFIWFRIHKILTQANVNRYAVNRVFIQPFSAFSIPVRCSPETINKVLDDVLCGLPSNTIGHKQLNQSSLEKLQAVSCLGDLWSVERHFAKVLTRFTSKYLLQVSPSNLDIAVLSLQNSINYRYKANEGLSLILKDARNWNSYRLEMSTILHQLQETYKETEIDLRFVRKHDIWNLGPDVDFMFPGNLKAVSEQIVETFQLKYPTRNASIHSLAGQMILRSNVWTCNGNAVRICLSTGQGGVLGSFGDREISLAELGRMLLFNQKEDLGMHALVAILKSLMTEYPILEKKPANNVFGMNDTFRVNVNFQPTADLIELPDPDYSGAPKGSSLKAERNHFTAIDLEQIVRAAVMKLLKHERELEIGRVRDVVVERLGSIHDLTAVQFEEVVRKLEADGYLDVYKSFVRYVL